MPTIIKVMIIASVVALVVALGLPLFLGHPSETTMNGVEIKRGELAIGPVRVTDVGGTAMLEGDDGVVRSFEFCTPKPVFHVGDKFRVLVYRPAKNDNDGYSWERCNPFVRAVR